MDVTKAYNYTKRIITILLALFIAVVFSAEGSTVAMAASGHWKKSKGKKTAYILSDGTKATGVIRIGKKIYYFNRSGRLGRARRERRIKWNGDIYSVKKNGTVRRGWNTYGKKLYYFGGSLGAMQKDKDIDGIHLYHSGRAGKCLNSSIKIKGIRILKAQGVFGRSKPRQLRAAWNWVIRHCHYRQKYPLWTGKKWRWGYSPWNATSAWGVAKHGAVWVKKYANDMLGSSRGGNCYGFACAFAGLADTIGYNPIVVVSRTANSGNRDRSADGYSRHGWVRINGRVYDPEACKVGWRYVYGAYGIGLRTKATHYIRFSKVNGAAKVKEKRAAGKSSVRKLFRKKGKYYYVSKKGKKRRANNIVILYNNKYYYFSRAGKNVKGLRVVKEKLYRFSKKSKLGYYMGIKEYKKYQNVIKEGKPYSDLKKLIGKAKTAPTISDGCYSDKAGNEVTYDYGQFMVLTFAPEDGSAETIISVDAK